MLFRGQDFVPKADIFSSFIEACYFQVCIMMCIC
jgi:hypothetical protein